MLTYVLNFAVTWAGCIVSLLVLSARLCRFVFVMGTSIAVSFDAARRRAVSKSMMFRRILRRSVILFVFGLALSNHGIVASSAMHYSVCLLQQ